MCKTPLFKVVVVFIVIVIAAILVPCGVNLLFLTCAPVPIMEAHFSSDSLLQYIGTVIAGICTAGLGVVALYQNDQIEKKNEIIHKERGRWEKENTKRPFFAIESIRSGTPIDPQQNGDYEFSLPGDRHNISFLIALKNVGDGPAVNIVKLPDTAFGELPDLYKTRLACMSGETIEFRIAVPIGNADSYYDFKEVARFEYDNILGQRYYQVLEMCVKEREPVRERVTPEDNSECYVPSDMEYAVRVKPISCQKTTDLHE